MGEPLGSLIDDLISRAADSSDDRIVRGSPVGWSPDMARIQNLPRRVLNLKDPRAAEAWTKHLRLERTKPCNCVARYGFCITAFNSVQGWVLEEAMDSRGVVCSITVGGGKTGLGIMLPMAVPDVKVALLIVPSQVKHQLKENDFPQWSEHFRTPNLAGGPNFIADGRPVLHVYSYNEISNPKRSALLRTLGKIDLVIADECQGLANKKTATTTRYLRIWDGKFADGTPNPSRKANAAVMSGSLTKKSIRDHAHLDVLCLGNRAPVPHSFQVVEEWAALLDAGKFVSPTGEFAKFMKPGETPREGFRRRFTETFGVIATSERPDGEELVEEMEVEVVARQLAAGFYYRWAFKAEEIPKVPEWRAKRKEFFRELRAELNSQRVKENYDSPKLLVKAAIRWHKGYTFFEPTGHRHAQDCYLENEEEGTRELICGKQPGPTIKHEIPPFTKKGPLPTWASEFWPDWEKVHKTVHPVTQPVWINDFLVKDAAAWLLAGPRRIAWFEFVEFGHAVANMAKVPYYGGGEQASIDILKEDGSRPIVASIKAHGTGKNLQRAFWQNLVMNPPSDGAMWEQLIGRTHRPGQAHTDGVSVELYRHTLRWKKAFQTARSRALYIQQTLGSPQRLCQARYGFDPNEGLD